MGGRGGAEAAGGSPLRGKSLWAAAPGSKRPGPRSPSLGRRRGRRPSWPFPTLCIPARVRPSSSASSSVTWSPGARVRPSGSFPPRVPSPHCCWKGTSIAFASNSSVAIRVFYFLRIGMEDRGVGRRPSTRFHSAKGRGRDASCPAPPARIRTCTFMHPALTSGA